MMDKNCANCYYADMCASNEICNGYTPVDDVIDMDDYIDQRRDRFHQEWAGYTDVDTSDEDMLRTQEIIKNILSR